MNRLYIQKNRDILSDWVVYHPLEVSYFIRIYILFTIYIAILVEHITISRDSQFYFKNSTLKLKKTFPRKCFYLLIFYHKKTLLGYLYSHRANCLRLLHSCPDLVHNALLNKGTEREFNFYFLFSISFYLFCVNFFSFFIS